VTFAPEFHRPAAGRLRVGSGWDADRSGRRHGALDIALTVGTPVYAIAGGRVIRANPTDDEAGGIWCGLRHDDLGGLVSRYMHLSRLDVRLGDVVGRGEQLGLSGDTGHSSAPHLHLDLKAPAALLPAIAAEVGTPGNGWLPFQEPYGIGIPAEPWIPVDTYRRDTIDNARRLGIPLYKRRSAGATVLAIGGLVAGVTAWKLLGW
jgi:murein DD-endopeptidase MepM/ murein hydrolase activator NlpD